MRRRIVIVVAVGLSCATGLGCGERELVYTVDARFPGAVADHISVGTDVRIGGVTVGSVREVKIDPATDMTTAVLEIEPDYAPISKEARALLRQTTLLGETYVELTSRGRKPEVP